LQLSGMVVLGVAGATGVMAFRSFADALRRRAEELHGVTSQLEQKHRAFLAATSDANGARPDDMAALTASIAGQVGADFACCYLVSDDDRRLGGTLAVRAGGHLASAHLVALTRRESARYSLMNELVKEASGKTMNEVLELVLARGVEMIRYETGRAILFQPGDTYVGLDESAPAEPVDAVLARVREGETTLRNLVTEEE